MRMLSRLLLATVFATFAGGVMYVGDAAAQELPTLQRGDTGDAVEVWQQHLGEWLAYARPARTVSDSDGTFGASTEAATRELQRFVGLEPDGVVREVTWVNLYERLGARADLLLRRTSGVTPAWPIPIPQWYWEWARWYLGHGEFRDRPRDPAVRPASAPTPIPNWGWRRMLAHEGASLEEQAVKLVQDRVREVFRQQLRMPPSVARSEVAGGWVVVGSSLVGHDDGGIAAWLRLERGRWVPWNLGRVWSEESGRKGVNEDPRFVPCDLRPVGPENYC